MVSSDQYKEIILIEDHELVGLSWRLPDGSMPGFEVDLLIDKSDGLDENALPLISRMIQ
jgi:hypothetical protein